MGDRVHVTLTLPIEHEVKALEILERHGELPDMSEGFHEHWSDDRLAMGNITEVNYGQLSASDDLIAAGIAFDVEFEAGCEFGKGTTYVRFAETGEVIKFSVYDEDKGVPLDRLVPQLHDYNQLQRAILDHKRKTVPLPWDHQVEYGKRHCVLRLIKAT